MQTQTVVKLDPDEVELLEQCAEGGVQGINELVRVVEGLVAQAFMLGAGGTERATSGTASAPAAQAPATSTRAAPSPGVKVRCKCGWSGRHSDLADDGDGLLMCPECGDDDAWTTE